MKCFNIKFLKLFFKTFILTIAFQLLLSGCSEFNSGKGILIVYFSNLIPQNQEVKITKASITISSFKIIPENYSNIFQKNYSINSGQHTIELVFEDSKRVFIGNIELDAGNNYSIYFHIDEINLMIGNKKISPVILFDDIQINDQINLNINQINFITIELDLYNSIIPVNDDYYLLPVINLNQHGIKL
jgi:hypothetical protein